MDICNLGRRFAWRICVATSNTGRRNAWRICVIIFNPGRRIAWRICVIIFNPYRRNALRLYMIIFPIPAGAHCMAYLRDYILSRQAHIAWRICVIISYPYRRNALRLYMIIFPIPAGAQSMAHLRDYILLHILNPNPWLDVTGASSNYGIMLKYLSIFLVLALASCSGGGTAESDPTAGQPVTIFLVRHAEKDLEVAKDPPLTLAGEERAELLKRLLADAGIGSIFSSDTRRTRSTAAPLAEQLGVEPIIYNPKLDPSELLPFFLNARERGNILIVGHSNTIPATVNALLGEDRYSNLDESTYDKVFVVHHWGMQEAAAYMLSVGAINEKAPEGDRN